MQSGRGPGAGSVSGVRQSSVQSTSGASSLAWDEYQRLRSVNAWAVAFVLAAALFNPLVPAHLDREVWRFLGVGCAILFGAFAGARLAGKPNP